MMSANTEKVGLRDWALMILLEDPRPATLKASLPLDNFKIFQSVNFLGVSIVAQWVKDLT